MSSRACAILVALVAGCSGADNAYPPAPDEVGSLALSEGSYETDAATYVADYGTLLAEHDIVLVGHRGIDGSTVLRVRALRRWRR